MTLKERVIVETYTGVCMTSGEERSEVYKYMAELMGRPVFTHELAEDAVVAELKERSKSDFINLCKSESNSINNLKCKACGNDDLLIEGSDSLGVAGCYWIRCPKCGAEQKDSYSTIDEAIEAYNKDDCKLF